MVFKTMKRTEVSEILSFNTCNRRHERLHVFLSLTAELT